MTLRMMRDVDVMGKKYDVVEGLPDSIRIHYERDQGTLLVLVNLDGRYDVLHTFHKVRSFWLAPS